MHEEKSGENRDAMETWEEIWSEHTPGTEGGLKLYFKEILGMETNCSSLSL